MSPRGPIPAWEAAERVVGLEALALAPEQRPLPLDDPLVGRRDELLLELDVAFRHLEEVAQGVDDAVGADVVTGPLERAPQMELHVARVERRQGLAVLLDDRLGHPVDGVDVGVVAHG